MYRHALEEVPGWLSGQLLSVADAASGGVDGNTVGRSGGLITQHACQILLFYCSVAVAMGGLVLPKGLCWLLPLQSPPITVLLADAVCLHACF